MKLHKLRSCKVMFACFNIIESFNDSLSRSCWISVGTLINQLGAKNAFPICIKSMNLESIHSSGSCRKRPIWCSWSIHHFETVLCHWYLWEEWFGLICSVQQWHYLLFSRSCSNQLLNMQSLFSGCGKPELRLQIILSMSRYRVR